MATHSPVNLSTMEPNLPAPPSTMAHLCPANLSAMVLPHLAQPNAMVYHNLVGIPSNLLARLSSMSITGLTETSSDTAQTNLAGMNDNTLAQPMSLANTTTLWPPAPGDLIQAVAQALAWTLADQTPPVFDFQMSSLMMPPSITMSSQSGHEPLASLLYCKIIKMELCDFMTVAVLVESQLLMQALSSWQVAFGTTKSGAGFKGVQYK